MASEEHSSDTQRERERQNSLNLLEEKKTIIISAPGNEMCMMKITCNPKNGIESVFTACF